MELQLLQKQTGEFLGIKDVPDLLKQLELLPAQKQSDILTKVSEIRKVLDKMEAQIKAKAKAETEVEAGEKAEWYGHLVQMVSTPSFDEAKMIKSEDMKFVKKYIECKKKYIRFTGYKKVI